MIKILKESKKTKLTKEDVFTEQEAKVYLLELTKRLFSLNHFKVTVPTKSKEQKALVDYFSEQYLIENSEDNRYTFYTLNEKIRLEQRTKNKGARPASLRGFKVKIENIIPNSEVVLIYKATEFHIIIKTFESVKEVVCNYQLEILKAFIYNEYSVQSPLEFSDTTVKTINKLFTKQRSYYKKKNG